MITTAAERNFQTGHREPWRPQGRPHSLKSGIAPLELSADGDGFNVPEANTEESLTAFSSDPAAAETEDGIGAEPMHGEPCGATDKNVRLDGSL